MADNTKLTETDLDNFKFFLKYLANNNLIDEAYDRLKAKGFTKIKISADPIYEVQSLIKEKAVAKGGPSKSDEAVINCAHVYIA